MSGPVFKERDQGLLSPSARNSNIEQVQPQEASPSASSDCLDAMLGGGIGGLVGAVPTERFTDLFGCYTDPPLRSSSSPPIANAGARVGASPETQAGGEERPHTQTNTQRVERQDSTSQELDAGGIRYVVGTGDTLSTIAAQFGIPVALLARRNGLPDDAPLQAILEGALGGASLVSGIGRIYAGQVLSVPAGPLSRAGGGSQRDGTLPYNATALGDVVSSVLAIVPTVMRGFAQSNVPIILRHSAERRIRDASQVAYILATAQHESRFGMPNPNLRDSESLIEDHNPFNAAADGTYFADVPPRKKNGNEKLRIKASTREQLEQDYWDNYYGGILGNRRRTTDGRDFRGRGFVQLTGRQNYHTMSQRLTAEGFSYTWNGAAFGGPDNPPIDLEAHPEHVNQVPELAARVMVTGMQEGMFGARLDDFIHDGSADFVGARSTTNNDVAKNGTLVAGYAQNYRAALARWPMVFDIPPRGTATTVGN